MVYHSQDIDLHDKFENIGAKLIRKSLQSPGIARCYTTACILAQSLITAVEEYNFRSKFYRGKKGIEKATATVVEFIKRKA